MTSIKLRIMNKGKIVDKLLISTLQDFENRIAALEEGSESDEEEFSPVTYGFTSYADNQGETEWGTGTVETTGVVSGNYTQVEVKTNSTDQSFVGQKFYIISTAKTDGTIYTVYSDAGRTSAGFYVSISEN